MADEPSAAANFCNKIGTKRTCRSRHETFAFGDRRDIAKTCAEPGPIGARLIRWAPATEVDAARMLTCASWPARALLMEPISSFKTRSRIKRSIKHMWKPSYVSTVALAESLSPDAQRWRCWKVNM